MPHSATPTEAGLGADVGYLGDLPQRDGDGMFVWAVLRLLM
jgi:hypothetical protein